MKEKGRPTYFIRKLVPIAQPVALNLQNLFCLVIVEFPMHFC